MYVYRLRQVVSAIRQRIEVRVRAEMSLINWQTKTLASMIAISGMNEKAPAAAHEIDLFGHESGEASDDGGEIFGARGEVLDVSPEDERAIRRAAARSRPGSYERLKAGMR